MILPLLAFIYGCQTKLDIYHHRTQCENWYNPSSLCHLTKNITTNEWVAKDIGLYNIDYEWGYTYELLVERINMPTMFPGPPAIDYSVIKIISKTKEPSTTLFRIPIYHPKAIIKESAGNYRIDINRKQFICAEPSCTEMDNFITTDTPMLLEFRHDDNPVLPMVLMQVVCSASTPNTSDSCFANNILY